MFYLIRLQIFYRNLINYLIINALGNSQHKHINHKKLLIKTFFSENDFTNMIFTQLKTTNTSEHQYAIYARYMILFSSFCMPLFISISQHSTYDSSYAKQTFSDPTFRKYFIDELMNILNFRA